MRSCKNQLRKRAESAVRVFPRGRIRKTFGANGVRSAKNQKNQGDCQSNFRCGMGLSNLVVEKVVTSVELFRGRSSENTTVQCSPGPPALASPGLPGGSRHLLPRVGADLLSPPWFRLRAAPPWAYRFLSDRPSPILADRDASQGRSWTEGLRPSRGTWEWVASPWDALALPPGWRCNKNHDDDETHTGSFLVFGECAFPPVSLGPAGDCPCKD